MEITTLETWKDSRKLLDLDVFQAAKLLAKRKSEIKGIRERNEGMNQD